MLACRAYRCSKDNEGAVQLAKNPITKSNSKHIDIKEVVGY